MAHTPTDGRADEEKVERLAKKLLHGGDGNAVATDLESARRQARRILEESEARTRQGYELEPEDDDVIRRSSTETAASGETATPRTSTGE